MCRIQWTHVELIRIRYSHSAGDDFDCLTFGQRWPENVIFMIWMLDLPFLVYLIFLSYTGAMRFNCKLASEWDESYLVICGACMVLSYFEDDIVCWMFSHLDYWRWPTEECHAHIIPQLDGGYFNHPAPDSSKFEVYLIFLVYTGCRCDCEFGRWEI